MGDIIEMNNTKQEEQRSNGLHQIVIAATKNFNIPDSLTFVPYVFDEGFEYIDNIHNRAAYLMACLYTYFPYDEATDLMNQLCDILNEDINEFLEEDGLERTFSASFIAPSKVDFKNKNGEDDYYISNCEVDWEAFNEDFIDRIFDEKNGLFNVIHFIFCDDSFVFNNKYAEMSKEEIFDMFGIEIFDNDEDYKAAIESRRNNENNSDKSSESDSEEDKYVDIFMFI